MRRVIAPSWHPSAVLLTVQLLGVLLYPFMDGPAGRAALSLFGLVVLVFAVRAVQATPALTAVSLVLGLPILVLTVIEVVQELPPPLLLLHASLLAAFYFYLGVIFPLVSPAVVFVALVLPLVGHGQFSYLYIYGTTLMALLYGLVYLVRHKTSLWFYGLAFSIFYMLVLVWQTYYALATVRRNHWGTR